MEEGQWNTKPVPCYTIIHSVCVITFRTLLNSGVTFVTAQILK